VLLPKHRYRHHYHNVPDGVCEPAIAIRDLLAIQLKLNELIAAEECISNRLVNVEGLTQDEL
jgi:low affinity Fe/Cu permease